jgi:hypothetical protein
MLQNSKSLQNFIRLNHSIQRSVYSDDRMRLCEKERRYETRRSSHGRTKMKRAMRRERGLRLNLLLLTFIYLELLIAGGSKLSAAFAIPHDSAEKALAYMTQHGWTIQLGSFFELLSAIPLGIFIATTVSRMRVLGVRAAGESIAFLGGMGATLLLVLSALTNWSLTRPGIAEAAGAAIALRAVSFAAAGPGFVVMLGFFLASVSIAAGLHGNLPRWLMWLGIFVALACELASLTVLNFTAGYFIPVGRMGSIVWMIGVSLTLRPSSLTTNLQRQLQPATSPIRT